LAPNSPGTDQIDTLISIGFVAAAVVVVAVNVALFYVLRRYRSERGARPRQISGGRGIQFRVGAALTAFAAILLIASIVITDNARETPTTGDSGLQVKNEDALRIEATGQQWLWRYDYPNEAFSYYKLVVPVDTAVVLDLVSTDVIHTWNVPDLAGKRDAVPGKTNRVVFRAEEEGTYSGSAATLSGQGYASMRTEVRVVSPEEYETFVKTQKAEIQEAQDRVVGILESGEEP
jgi:cytochrome c oxidase subunit II